MAPRSARIVAPTTLTFKTCWRAPGYRDLRLVLTDPKTGQEYELPLPPKDVQRLIFECADAAKQINDHPPLDWDTYRAQIVWPSITPWKPGPARQATTTTDRPLNVKTNEAGI